MEGSQPPRRQAAIKATTNFAESSSDESKGSGNEADHYQSTSRVRRSKSQKDGKRIKTYGRKRSRMDSQAVDAAVAGTSVRKRKRASVVNSGTRRKRQRGTTQNVTGNLGEDGIEDESDLTPITSDDDQMEAKPFVRPLAEFPLQFTNTPRASKGRQTNRTKSQVDLSVELLSLDEDSDDLPDIGTVLSQQDVSAKKGKRPKKLPSSTQKHRPKSRRKSSQDNSPSFTSSPKSPLTLVSSSLLSSSRRELMDDNSMTEANTSDHFDLSYLNDDSDLELNSVSVGDLCLAKAKAAETTYWPARVLEVKRLSTGKGKQKKIFRVMFLDRKEKDIPRDQFYTTLQDEFGTCAIGEFESSHIDVVNDLDEETRQNGTTGSGRRVRSSSHSRSPSPIYVESPPVLSGPDFCDLPLHHQLPYVTPILKAIMNEEATWALRRHKMYIKGGATRQKLKDEGGMRGAVDAKNADDFLPLVEKWCLGVRGPYFVGDQTEKPRAEGRQAQDNACDEGGKLGVESGAASPKPPYEAADSPPVVEARGVATQLITQKSQSSEVENPLETESTRAEPSSPLSPLSTQPTVTTQEGDQFSRNTRLRQRGSPAYENLPPLDKVQYCLDVLVPEAFNQILLWRIGGRKSVEVMWDNVKEEERLHDRGEELLKETDWVMDIMRLRKIMETNLSKNKSDKGPTSKTSAKALRRTRSGRVGGMVGSYKE